MLSSPIDINLVIVLLLPSRSIIVLLISNGITVPSLSLFDLILLIILREDLDVGYSKV